MPSTGPYYSKRIISLSSIYIYEDLRFFHCFIFSWFNYKMSSLYENIATNAYLSTIGLSVVALLTVYLTHKLYKWRNPKCNGVLPPGSMGLPFIGETLQLIMPSPSLDLPPFIKNRIKRYLMNCLFMLLNYSLCYME